jgi:hypothetical protein
MASIFRGKSRDSIRLSSSLSFLLLMNLFSYGGGSNLVSCFNLQTTAEFFSVVCYDILFVQQGYRLLLEQWRQDGSKLTRLD